MKLQIFQTFGKLHFADVSLLAGAARRHGGLRAGSLTS